MAEVFGQQIADQRFIVRKIEDMTHDFGVHARIILESIAEFARDFITLTTEASNK